MAIFVVFFLVNKQTKHETVVIYICMSDCLWEQQKPTFPSRIFVIVFEAFQGVFFF